MDIEDYYSNDILEKMDAFSDEEVAGAIREIKSEYVFTNNVPEATLEKVTRLYLAMKGKRDKRALDAISIKCVYGITKLGFNPCLAQSLLADKDTCVICECDGLGLKPGGFSTFTGEQLNDPWSDVVSGWFSNLTNTNKSTLTVYTNKIKSNGMTQKYW